MKVQDWILETNTQRNPSRRVFEPQCTRIDGYELLYEETLSIDLWIKYLYVSQKQITEGVRVDTWVRRRDHGTRPRTDDATVDGRCTVGQVTIVNNGLIGPTPWDWLDGDVNFPKKLTKAS
ncbi:hypothetical protein HMI56_005375 [Coelomomyces lativittatus]|nr:hypothetical protein HMI56_005375 [Coelomomyces lativittatus]